MIITCCVFVLITFIFLDRYKVQKNLIPSPLFTSVDHVRPISFGPGTHYELTVYSGVQGWDKEYSPKWAICRKLKGRYFELVSSVIEAQANMEVFFLLGENYFFLFVRRNGDSSSIVRLHEWDDDYNFYDYSAGKFVRKVCKQ